MVSLKDVFARFWVTAAYLSSFNKHVSAELLYVMFKKEIKVELERDNIPGTMHSLLS
jgi:hypothetical protein